MIKPDYEQFITEVMGKVEGHLAEENAHADIQPPTNPDPNSTHVLELDLEEAKKAEVPNLSLPAHLVLRGYTPRRLVVAEVNHTRYALLLGDYSIEDTRPEKVGSVVDVPRLDFGGEVRNGYDPKVFIERVFGSEYRTNGNTGSIVPTWKGDEFRPIISGRGDPTMASLNERLQRGNLSGASLTVANSIMYNYDNLLHL